MTIRLYLDEDAGETGLVMALRLRGLDAIAPHEAAMRGRTDEEQLIWATDQNRVLYSCNRRDFCRIHSAWMRKVRNHSGIILVEQQRYSVGEQMRRLLRLISQRSAEEMQNRLEFLSAWSVA